MQSSATLPATVYCDPGHRGSKRMPWSEVCIHMGVADQWMNFTVLADGTVQLFQDGRPFSAPILSSEAGLYDNDDNEHRFYYYPDLL